MGSKGRPYRTIQVDGFEVLIGRGDAENDRLTFEVAEPADFWMHVAGTPGSHVVIRNPEDLAALPREVIERAASHAAWFSKSRAARGKVEVHFCRAADVRKPRGFEPGKVMLARWKSVKVHPVPPAESGNEEEESGP